MYAKYFLIAVLSVSQLSQIAAQDGEPAAAGGAEGTGETKVYPPDELLYNTYKDKVCATIPQLGGGGGEVGEWREEMTEDEVYELALLNLAYGLTTDATAHLPVSLGWKKYLVDYMASITVATCPSAGLSSKFINGVKNLFLYYLYKLSVKGPPGAAGNETAEGAAAPAPDVTEAAWKDIMGVIYTCSNNIHPILINEYCGEFQSYVDSSGASVPMNIIGEQLDEEIASTPGAGIDIIIDSIWWMFSTTYARCYRFYYPNEDIILKFYAHFRDDFLQGLHNRWVSGGDNMDFYSIILGPVKVQEEWLNLRKCATTAYDFEGMSGRQLVRPLLVHVENQIIKNFKTVG